MEDKLGAIERYLAKNVGTEEQAKKLIEKFVRMQSSPDPCDLRAPSKQKPVMTNATMSGHDKGGAALPDQSSCQQPVLQPRAPRVLAASCTDQT